MNFAMSRVGKLVLGLVFLVAGAGGLVYVNMQLVPAAMSQQPEAVPSASAAPTQQPLAADTGTMEEASAAASGTASAAPSASAPVAAGPDAPVRFELTRIALKDAGKAIEPLALWLKKNPGDKVVLVGHGDPKTRTRDYVEVGRARALAVRRALLESGIIAARIQVQPVEMEGNQVKGTEQFAGTVDVRLLKGDR